MVITVPPLNFLLVLERTSFLLLSRDLLVACLGCSYGIAILPFPPVNSFCLWNT